MEMDMAVAVRCICSIAIERERVGGGESRGACHGVKLVYNKFS